MTLPSVWVEEVHYWVVMVDGEEYPTRHTTQADADKHAQRFVDKQLATHVEL